MFAAQRLEHKVDNLNRKLDLIMQQLGIQMVPATVGGSLAEVDELIGQGKKIAAIKRYRELTGDGLKEAKDAVERREAGGSW